MKVLETCMDDFEMINKCGCVPCSWKDSVKLNGGNICIDYTKLDYG